MALSNILRMKMIAVCVSDALRARQAITYVRELLCLSSCFSESRASKDIKLCVTASYMPHHDC